MPPVLIVLELEIGVVGGEEDGITGAMDERLYSTPDDALRVADALGLGERGRFLLAATFGNVHGVYQPGHVVLRPGVLKEIQDAVESRHGRERPFYLVFHGGSGSSLDDIREAIGFGVVKMNVDTDAAVRLHPADRRPRVDALRRRAACRRRYRRQGGLRPPVLGEGRRGRDGRPGGPGRAATSALLAGARSGVRPMTATC